LSSSLSQLVDVPQKVIDIKQSIFKDHKEIKLDLIHHDVYTFNISRISLSNMCNTIDNLIIQIYKSRSTHIPPDFKVHIEYIIKNWIEKDEQQGKILFLCCSCTMVDILFNVIWDDEMKKMIVDLNKIPFNQFLKIQTKYSKSKKEKH
jgi:hypothetical protein